MRAARPARLIVAVVMTIVLLTAAGCSSSDNASSTKTTGKTDIGNAATATSTPMGTSETTAVRTTQVPSSPTGLDTPKAAAERLYSAWKASDRAGALTVAEPIAVDAMFGAAPGDYRLYSGCDTGEFAESGCLYRGDAGTIQLTMEKRNALWVVISAFYAAN